jgi:hypothetical protein
MALASRAMAGVGAAARAPARRVEAYAAAAAALGALPHLKALHWEEASGKFLDWGLHTEGVALAPTTAPQADGTVKARGRGSARRSGGCSWLSWAPAVLAAPAGPCQPAVSSLPRVQPAHPQLSSLSPTPHPLPRPSTPYSPQTVYKRVVKEPPKAQLVPSFGYVSLFPLLMQLLPPGSPELGRQIALLRDESLLWTPYGLRSLARTASLYKQ